MAPPINDNVVDAIDLLVGVLKETVSGTIVDATIEPDFEGDPGINSSQAVWYHFQPVDDSRVALRVTKTGGTAAFVPEADIWECTTYPPADASDLSYLTTAGDGTASPPYEHEWPLAAGTHYLISVEDYNFDPGEEGAFDLDIQLVPSLLYESWEEASIDPIIWELHRQSASPIDPNAGVWSLDTSEFQLGAQSIHLVPTTQLQQLFHHDVIEGGQADRDYWIAYRFKIEGTWADVLATDTEGGFLPAFLSGNNFYPHTSSGIVADLLPRNFWADTSTTGYVYDSDFNPWYIDTEVWHELRIMYHRRSSDNHLLVTEILNGVTILGPNFDLGSFGALQLTGVAWRSTFNGATAGSVWIDPLVWSPDTDPGALVSGGALNVPFIASTTTLFPFNFTSPLEFISPTTTVFDAYLSGDMDIPAPFIGPTTSVFEAFLLSPNRVRVSQEPVEIITAPTDALVRMSQGPVEVIIAPADALARLSQFPVEVIMRNNQREYFFVVVID